MAEEQTVEQRIAALEAAVRELQSRLPPPTAALNWWEKIGPITDREAFEQVLEYGRAFRYADRPPDEPGEQP
jgi:hypothetical protein